MNVEAQFFIKRFPGRMLFEQGKVFVHDFPVEADGGAGLDIGWGKGLHLGCRFLDQGFQNVEREIILEQQIVGNRI